MDHETSAAGFWEARYADSDRVWSGRVNGVLAEVAAELEPGSALDLGCGEGGDAVWLVKQGWDVTGVDLSPTAIERARTAAAAQGIDEQRLRLAAADLAVWDTDDRFDLVTCSYLHSWPVEIPREEILRRAAGFVGPGGTLLITAHAAPPPWAQQHMHDGYTFPTPESDLAALALDADEWEVLACERRDRETMGPDGAPAHIDDGVVRVRRSTAGRS
ncbi:MAG TPA: class I SAM-dependent methyltransferase [Microbacterium sp.]|nr:class I SAM-dependent methyltransferase [Microbacterium sp.]